METRSFDANHEEEEDGDGDDGDCGVAAVGGGGLGLGFHMIRCGVIFIKYSEYSPLCG